MTGARKPRLVVPYMGENIYRNTGPGFTGARLKWTCGRLAADTLDGIKRLIRESRT